VTDEWTNRQTDRHLATAHNPYYHRAVKIPKSEVSRRACAVRISYVSAKYPFGSLAFENLLGDNENKIIRLQILHDPWRLGLQCGVNNLSAMRPYVGLCKVPAPQL